MVAAAAVVFVAQTRPATRPDLSTPEKTWAAVCVALKAGDVAGFRGCFYNTNEISRVFMAAYSDMTVTTFQLAGATAKLGPDGRALSKKLEGVYDELVASGRGRTTTIAGETAQWSRTTAGTKEVMYFRQVNGRWLIDTEQSYSLDSAEGRKAAEDLVASAEKQLPVLKGIIADVAAGKITTLEEVRKRMGG
jgi:hypothetical protein